MRNARKSTNIFGLESDKEGWLFKLETHNRLAG